MCYKVLVSTVGLPRTEWLKYRKRGIGGSDAGAVCGLNPYVSPMQVFVDKTTMETDDVDNEAMRTGRDLEEYVAKRFTEVTGLKVRRKNAMLYSEKYPFMFADVDRMIVGENAGLECKTASPYSKDKWENGEAPAHYLIQCHHYMAVTGAEAWYLAVLIYGVEFKYIKVERDEEIIKYLCEIESEFWNNHVVPGLMPSPDGTEISEAVIRQYFSKSNPEGRIRLKDELNDKLKRREELDELIERLETEKRQIEQEVKMYMQENEAAENESYIVTWKNVVSQRIDAGRLKKEEPELYKRFVQSVSSRRFTVKAA